MQAIILAAGMGKRLGDLTHDNTKCMIKVNGITLIERMLNQLDKFNLNKIVIVIGYEGLKLQSYISTLNIKTNIEYVVNSIYDKTNNIYSLYLAKNQLQEDDTLLLESDLIFEDEVLRKLINAEYPSLALVAKFESWMDGTVVRIDEDNNIKELISAKFFKYKDISDYYKTVNIYKFSKSFSNSHYIPFLEAYCKALGNNEYYEQVLKVITLLDKPEIKALRLDDESWYEIDDIQDLDIAESVFVKNPVEKLEKIYSRYGGYWRYPNLLDYCYLVNPYFPPTRLKDEIKSNFDALLTQYPSGMKINSLLAAKYFGIKQDNILVGNGAAELIKEVVENHTHKLGVIYPTFEEYPNRKPKNNLVIYNPSIPNFRYTSHDIISFFDTKSITDLLIINPDNPSGNLLTKKDVILLIEWSKNKNIQLIIDESFIDFADNPELHTVLLPDVINQNPHLIIIKSISKSYGVPGLRLGILISSNANLIKILKKEVAIWNINSFGEFYLQIYGKYEKSYIHACNEFKRERDTFKKELDEIPYLRVIPSQANYFLCEVLSPITSKVLATLLYNKYNILIKDCGNKTGFENKNYIRIAVRNREDNLKFINALKHISHEQLDTYWE